MEVRMAVPGRGDWLVPLAVVALGISCVMTQLALMRELLCAFYGNELLLGGILGNWLLLSAVGAWAGRRVERGPNLVITLLVSQVWVALLPLASVAAIQPLRDALFGRGVVPGFGAAFAASFVVLAPSCLISGFFLALACAVQEHGVTGAAIPAGGVGRVYIADSIGSVVGGLLFTFVLIRYWNHFTLLCVPAVLNLGVAAALALWTRRQVWAVFALISALGVLALMWNGTIDTRLVARQYPEATLLFHGNSPYGKVVVTASSGQLNFFENGQPLCSTHNIEQVEETVHYALAQREDAHRVLLLGGGITGTAKEILRYGVREVTYLELDPLTLEVGKKYLPRNLADDRIRVVAADGRRFLKDTDQRFEVVIVDLPDPANYQLNRFYTAEFFAEVQRVLTADGVLAFGLGRYENYLSPDLARLLASGHRTLRQVFAHALIVPGGRVFFLGSNGPLYSDFAERLARLGMKTKLITPHYLKAMLSADRMAEVQRALSRPAAINRDFNPVLYYYQMVHWLSQFGAWPVLTSGVLGVVMVWYAVRLKPVPLALWASGFAGSALEVVLLVAFQALYGSLYRQLGLIVTWFMAGLGLGAWWMHRRLKLERPSCPDARGVALSKPDPRSLAKLSLAVAVFAGALPVALRLLETLAHAPASGVIVQAAIGLLTGMLALLVGLEFPLAVALVSGGAAARAGRLYAADFVGAALGAWLAGALLIPLLGVTVVCGLTMAPALGAAVCLWRREVVA